MGWSGCIVFAYWFIANAVPSPPPSIGFPGYIYPDEAICEMYQGVNCTNTPNACCYNEALWCPSADNCTTDNGAYPYGDERVYSNQMGSPYALAPFPNSLFWNWCTILILAFGNRKCHPIESKRPQRRIVRYTLHVPVPLFDSVGALDFQVRCMASKTPDTARIGCFIGGLFTFFIGVPFAFLGAITRYVFVLHEL